MSKKESTLGTLGTLGISLIFPPSELPIERHQSAPQQAHKVRLLPSSSTLNCQVRRGLF